MCDACVPCVVCVCVCGCVCVAVCGCLWLCVAVCVASDIVVRVGQSMLRGTDEAQSSKTEPCVLLWVVSLPWSAADVGTTTGSRQQPPHGADGDAARAEFAREMLSAAAQPSSQHRRGGGKPNAGGASAPVSELVDEAKADLQDWLAADTVALSEEDMQAARYEAEVEDMAEDLANILAMNDDDDDDNDDDDNEEWDAMPLVGRLAAQHQQEEAGSAPHVPAAVVPSTHASTVQGAGQPAPSRGSDRRSGGAQQSQSARPHAGAASASVAGGGGGARAADQQSNPEDVERLRGYLAVRWMALAVPCRRLIDALCVRQSRIGEEALVVAYRATKSALAGNQSRRALLAEMVDTVFGGDGARAAKYQPFIQRLVEEDEKLAAARHAKFRPHK